MKAKHNKKRNTAFIFEALSQEMTKAIIENSDNKKSAITAIVGTFFRKGTELRKELDLYRDLNESSEPDREMATRVLQEVKKDYDTIDKDKLFGEQTALINRINKRLSKSVFSNFVGNYKYLATVAQIFNRDSSPKNRVLLENTVLDTMTKAVPLQEMKSVDNVVYRTFVDKFNESYSPILPDEQKVLLGKYVSSFSDNGIDFKVYMNEEIGRLKEKTESALEQEDVAADEEMKTSATKVQALLEKASEKPIDEELIRDILNIQNFIREVES
tara:strand:- start:668 stop:1483 length:816 start_codon:yes stop_codon:yes gene_type:complete